MLERFLSGTESEMRSIFLNCRIFCAEVAATSAENALKACGAFFGAACFAFRECQ
jgi:hypothetical protein